MRLKSVYSLWRGFGGDGSPAFFYFLPLSQFASSEIATLLFRRKNASAIAIFEESIMMDIVTLGPYATTTWGGESRSCTVQSTFDVRPYANGTPLDTALGPVVGTYGQFDSASFLSPSVKRSLVRFLKFRAEMFLRHASAFLLYRG